MRGTRCAGLPSRMTGAPTEARAQSAAFAWAAALFFFASAVLAAKPPVKTESFLQSRPSNEQSEEIRVRLDTVGTAFTLTGIGLRFPGSPLKRAGVYQALRVSWRKLADGGFTWTLEDRDTGTVLQKLKSRSLEVAGANLRLGLRPIPGRLSLRPQARDTKTDVIVSLDVEEYVRGVLPAEMPKGWPLEALKAQAVASRTYALHRKIAREQTGASYHVESTVMDQVYLVPVLSSEEDESRAQADRAVRETRGLILTSVDKGARESRPLAAYFHSDCGGRTEDARAVWGETGGGTTACPFAAQTKWRAEIPFAEITSLARAWFKRALPGSLVAIEAKGRNASGRVRELRLAWNDGAEAVIPAHEFRMRLGHDRVRSTNFKVESRDGTLSLIGQGFGHGVGLCQWGARHLAQNGRDFREILKLYYPQSRLVSGLGDGTKL